MKHWLRWALIVVVGITFAAPAWAAPPPWAPAHGYRRQTRVVYYEPVPFIYSGITYIPLRNLASLIGAALLWDSLRNRAVITYNGREIALVVGSRSIFYDDRTFLLPAAPLFVRNVVYVPWIFCDRYLGVPVRHTKGHISFHTSQGWTEYTVVSRPPGRISYGKARVVSKGSVHRRGTVQSAPRGGAPGQHRATSRGQGQVKHGAPKVTKSKGPSASPEKGRGAGRGGSKGHGRGGGRGR